MAAMSAPERAQFLSRVLGYERIRAAQDRLKERRSALRARHEALRSGSGRPGRASRRPRRAPRERVTAARGRRDGRNRRRRRRRAPARRDPAAVGRASAPARGGPACSSPSSGWPTIRCSPRPSGSQRLESQAAEAAAATLELDGVTSPARAAPGAPRRARRCSTGRPSAQAARNGVWPQLDEVRRHLLSVEERVARQPTSTQLDDARATGQRRARHAHRRRARQRDRCGPPGSGTRRTPRPSARGCWTSTRSSRTSGSAS